MKLELIKFELLKKNDTYIETVTTDFAYAHIFRAFKPKEEGVIWGIEVIGQALSTEMYEFLKEIEKKYRVEFGSILNTNINPVSNLNYKKIEKLYEKVKEIKEKLK